ncbi:16S rRNA (guanine(527)-N(7))-methyltransferase RsmG [Catenulispora subtropica]|uniref:Ribosomal RNA small subunit methyltransferase G n=1 Tax=Catenulispora subtropica TaxID=450798 RepID=A0ABN2QVJ3_9ACTN
MRPSSETTGSPGGDPTELMLGPAPAAVVSVFGDRAADAVRYAEILAGPGVTRGLLGPREVPRLWERHILNCAVVGELLPADIQVCDVGSGAGLPGIVLALARPDLTVTLLEPLLRRTLFLDEVIALLGLPNVRVLRGRAEEFAGRERFDVVTSRAVAPLDRLAGWSLPLLRAGGEMVALKGGSAEAELAESAELLAKLGATRWSVQTVGTGIVDPPTTVIRVGIDQELQVRGAKKPRSKNRRPGR